MSTSRSRRRARTLHRTVVSAAAIATTAGLLAVTPAGAAPSGPGHTGRSATAKAEKVTAKTAKKAVKKVTKKAPAKKAPAKKAARPDAAGFTPVRTLTGDVMAMTSTAKGQLWIAARGADDKLVLQHKDGARWRTHRMPMQVSPHDDVELHGSARGDVWMVAAGTLWHYTGSRWQKVSLPAGTTATAVYDVAGRDAYVGLRGDVRTTGVYTLRGSRWISHGRPDDGDHPYPPAWHPTDLRVADGKLFGNWMGRSSSAAQWQNSFAYEGGTWTNLFQTHFIGGGSYATLGAWLVPDATTQIVMGSGSSSSDMPWYPTCTMWTKAEGEKSCTSQWATGAAALLRGGRVVVGGMDYQHPAQSKVEATFGIRTRDGGERLISGDPGDRTVAMAVEPGTDIAWAATRTGSVTTLQNWKG
ncbi:hypothetical protein [Mobilicoccus caccae]|uniref:Uncharacterized protein n=1 Tax=Mobilicoccus caccae TaxID=1859295 RepID=A0ABQ6IWN4_9MICO|nr:hypothetical protein [Mobilicoccus caccae]GMA42340.1 hypothetical protein GCM10025883_43850 [Mobilicoccus caccae]